MKQIITKILVIFQLTIQDFYLSMLFKFSLVKRRQEKKSIIRGNWTFSIVVLNNTLIYTIRFLYTISTLLLDIYQCKSKAFFLFLLQLCNGTILTIIWSIDHYDNNSVVCTVYNIHIFPFISYIEDEQVIAFTIFGSMDIGYNWSHNLTYINNKIFVFYFLKKNL